MKKDYGQASIAWRSKYGSIIGTLLEVEIKNREDLSTVYTPGVGAVSSEIAKNPELSFSLTQRKNTVAVVSDGSAVLGLGNIGAAAALPVMEGKSALLKAFGGVNGVPVCLDTQDDEKIIETVKIIAPNFGGINLEDIAAPRCFKIEKALQKLGIPVFHDDQHGTAICVTAALFNAAKVAGKDMKNMQVVVNGLGAAGSAIVRMLLGAGIGDVVCVASKGIVTKSDPSSIRNWNHEELAGMTNKQGKKGSLADAMKGADVFIGVSVANIVSSEMIAAMAKKPIVFAMANPNPEILPDQALASGAYIAATGRSDFPNQINNCLAFPGLFRGALEARVPQITEEIKVAASRNLAAYIPENELSTTNIIPSPMLSDDRGFDMGITKAMSAAVHEIAKKRQLGIYRQSL